MVSYLRRRNKILERNNDAQALKGLPDSGKIPSLLTWHGLTEWTKDNEYIETGYRPISNSYLDCIRSCTYLHNETGNVHSHLLATIWMIVLSAYFYPYAKTHYPNAGKDDWIIFGLYFLGGAVCFGLSTAYHVFSNHSHAVHDLYHQLDLLGISVVTAGCFPPGIWYTFPCVAKRTRVLWIVVRF